MQKNVDFGCMMLFNKEFILMLKLTYKSFFSFFSLSLSRLFNSGCFKLLMLSGTPRCARAGRSAAEACRPRADEVVAASSSVCAWVGICMSGHIDENVDRPLHDF